MDSFSLEDEDMGDLFLTQNSSNLDKEEEKEDNENEEFLGLSAMDFSSPCVSLIPQVEKSSHYSDISDDDDMFEMEPER